MSNLTNINVSKMIADCKAKMRIGLNSPVIDIDTCIELLEGCLDSVSDSKLGRFGNSNKNGMMSRPIIMYLWYLIKQGKRVNVKTVCNNGLVSGEFLLVPMYDDNGKPNNNAIIPIVAKGDGCELGEYQKILFVEQLADFSFIDGEFIQRFDNGSMYIEECVNHNEYLDNLNSGISFNRACKITTIDGTTYLCHPALSVNTIITITEANCKPEVYRVTGNQHSCDTLNDPTVDKESDGYITQDIIIPLIHGIGSPGKYITDEYGEATAYRASIPVSRFMALASLFVSHELFKGKLAAEPYNDMWKRKARVKEWDMIDGFNKSIVEPFEKLFPNEDGLKVLTLAIDLYLLTVLGIYALQEGKADIRELVLLYYANLFGSSEEYNKIINGTATKNELENAETLKWMYYFLSMQEAWNSMPYVNHKDLRRSHNVMYNLEFTSADFNDAHGALVGAFASLPNGSDYTDVVTVPSRKRVNGRNVYSTKQMQVFKDHYGISAYILDDFDKYMLKCGATQFRGQFISQLSTIAQHNRKQLNLQTPNYLVIAPDQVAMFRDFLEKQYGYGTTAYWKLV